MKKAHVLLFLAILVMVPVASSGQSHRDAPAKISFDFMDADVRNVLRVLAEVAKKNIVIADDVKGKVTIKLENVSYAEAFEMVMKNNDLAKVEDENIIRVMTAKKLADERDRGAKERADFIREKALQQKMSEEYVTETVYVNYVDVAEVEKMVRGETSVAAKDVAQAQGQAAGGGEPVMLEKPKGLLSPNGVLTMVKWNNALIIRDTKANVDNIVRLIKEQDVAPQQIQIEARIVLATSTFSKELGIQWAANYNTRIRGEAVGSQGGRTVTGDSSNTAFTAPTNNLAMRNGVATWGST